MHRRIFSTHLSLILLLPFALTCTSRDKGAKSTIANGSIAPALIGGRVRNTAFGGLSRTPDEMGRIPVLMYHLFGSHESTWGRERGNFRRDLELLYERGYRPVNMVDILDKKIDLPAGLSPVVITFDDASPSQFRYIERDGKLVIDSTSAVGMWLEFAKTHPGWSNRAVFCMLPAASAGHAFFGDGKFDGQKKEWRLLKVKQLADLGFELCDHTLWHAQLDKYSDAVVQEQIARGALAIDSAVPGYRIRSFALPLGIWPKNRALAKSGSWTDPKTGRTVTYDFDAIFEVWGKPVPSPYNPVFNPLSIQRVRVTGNALTNVLDRLDRENDRYVSDGNPAIVAQKQLVATP
jgi:peptidoglycan/xylan/chitin deacetylase (PgdA/CDA1 family)